MCGLADFSRCGRQTWAHRNVPRTLTCCIRSKRFIGVSSAPRSQIALALLTRMSMPPKRSTACATAACTCSSSRMSQAIASAWPPAASTSAAAVWMVPGSFGFGTADFAAMTTLAPSRPARRAIARPMPREAPVMNRVLPWREAMAEILLAQDHQRASRRAFEAAVRHEDQVVARTHEFAQARKQRIDAVDRFAFVLERGNDLARVPGQLGAVQEHGAVGLVERRRDLVGVRAQAHGVRARLHRHHDARITHARAQAFERGADRGGMVREIVVYGDPARLAQLFE